MLCLFSDFISIELDRGQPRLLIDFGSGTLELKVKTKKTLDDGEWHKIDVFWDTEVCTRVSYITNCSLSNYLLIFYYSILEYPSSSRQLSFSRYFRTRRRFSSRV